jgi:hypothetical protein
MTSAHTAARQGYVASGTLTFPELFRLPATVDLTTAAKALGIHVNTAYKLVRRDAFPCPVLRLRRRYRVPTRALLQALHIEEIPLRLDAVTSGASSAARCTES